MPMKGIGFFEKMMAKKAKMYVTLAIIAIVLIVAIIVAVHISSGNAFRATSNTTSFGLKDIGELSTQAGFFTVVNVIDDSKRLWNWSIPFTASKYIFSYDGVIKAGIDFAQVEWNVDESTKIITIQLPESKFLSNVLDENSLKIYDERQSIFTPLTLSDIQASRQEMLAELEKTAMNNGLLEQASENAKTLIKGFLSGTYSPSEYSYVFE